MSYNIPAGTPFEWQVSMKEFEDGEVFQSHKFVYKKDAEAYAQAEREKGFFAEVIDIRNAAVSIKRSREYPDFREYLDGIVKGDDEQVKSYIDKCLAVKLKYPKV